MKERVLFLVISYHTINFFRPMIKTLLAEGHAVRILCVDALTAGAREDRFDSYCVNWPQFKWERIHEWGPTRVVIFNGFFRSIHAATKALQLLVHNVLIAEVAWLPQNNYIYIDRAIHQKSGLCSNIQMISNMDHLEKIPALLEEVKKKHYKPKPVPVKLPPDYVLVPTQLERDTSIQYASQHFKDMKSMVGYVRNNLRPDIPVVVKLHPKRHTDYVDENFVAENCIIIDDPNISMTDLVQGAHMVVGINSTSLIEALLFGRPVVALGENVAGADFTDPRVQPFVRFPLTDFGALQRIYDNPAEHHPAQSIIDLRLAYLIANQIDFQKPPRWAIDRIITGDTRPRTIDDYFTGEPG